MKLGKEIKETWAEIEELQLDGNLFDRYKPGDYKPVDFGEDGIIRMRFAGMHRDVDVSGSSVHATWIAGDLTAQKHQMHNDWFGEYSKCDLRQRLNTEFFDRLPDDLKCIIIPALKRQAAYTPPWDCYTDEVCDRLWIPSFAELFEGGYPDLFSDDESRAMGQFYWCRSAYGGNFFYGVHSRGGSYKQIAFIARPLVLGFST